MQVGTRVQGEVTLPLCAFLYFLDFEPYHYIACSNVTLNSKAVGQLVGDCSFVSFKCSV